jgi:hypothetical protein
MNHLRKLHNVFLLSLVAMFSLFSSAFAVAQTTVSPTSENFVNVVVNTTSATKTVTLKNTGAASITINSLAVTAGTPYAITPASTCLSPTLAAGASCTVLLTLSPTTLGAQPAGTLTITSTSTNSPNTVALSGTGVEPTALSATSESFGNVVINTASPAKTLTLYNYQLTPLTVSSITVPANYAVSGGTCGTTLAASSNCTISVTLTPNALGALPAGSLTVNTNASNTPLSAALYGTGVEPTALSMGSEYFGNVVVGQTSGIKTLTLYNYQPTTLTISSITVPAGYAVSSTTCGSTLGASSNCTISMTLTPTALGALPAGSLTVSTSATNSPLTASLFGWGVAPTTESATSINFGNEVVGTTSATKLLTITNNQTGALNFSSVVFGGPFALDTSANTTCPQSGGTVSGTLGGLASCKIGIVFKPTAVGATTGGQITVIDTAANSPQVVMLTGIGVQAATLSPSSVTFGNVAVGTTSAARNVTLTNNQTVSLNFSSITVPSPYGTAAVANACKVGTPVPAGGNCVISLTFSPTTPGAVPASAVTLNDDAPNSPQHISLAGTGAAAVAMVSAYNFGNVVVDQQAVGSFHLKNLQTIPLTISPITGFSGGYTLNTTGTTCPFSPSTLAALTSCVISINLTATATGPQGDTISIPYNAAGSPGNVTLSATAIPQAELSVSSLSFAAQFVGITSAPKPVQVTNEQNVGLTISSVNITGANHGDFAVTSACPTAPSQVPATSNCDLNVTFTPSASGTRTALLSINDTANNTPQTVTLTGAGNAPVLVSPLSITNFSANVGTTSAYQTITITNADTTVPLHISKLQLSGDFTQSATTCPMAPAALGGAGTTASCTVSVEFDPTIGGTRDGQLQIVDDARTTPQVVNLSGTGYNPLTISPPVLAFTSQLVGTVSPTQSITLTNHESKSETFTLTPPAGFTANSNCSSGVIAAGSACMIFVKFAPSTDPPSTWSGSLSIADSAAIGSPVRASLTGAATLTNPIAAVAVVSPGAGAAGTTVNVVITGNGWTHFSPHSAITFVDTNSRTYASDITVSSFTAVSANTIKATLVLTGGSGVVYGARNINITTPLSGGGTETARLGSAFIIADPTNAHSITSVTPAFGSQGQTLNVALTGSGTSWVQGTTFANFGDGITINSLTIADPLDPNPNQAVANITISNTTPIGYRTITMVTGGEFDVSVLSPQGNPIFQIGPNNATLVSVSPNTEPQGGVQPVTLTATGTHFLQNATQVSIGGVIVGDVLVNSPTNATAQVAVSASAIGPQNVTVSTGGEIAGLNNAFTITGATPALLSVAPSTGQQGQQNLNIVITGNAYTDFVSGQTSADFTGEITVNSVTVNNPNQVTVNITISGDANVGSITANLLSGPTGSVTLFPFTFSITPSSALIVSVTPHSVPQGGQVTLAVVGSNTSWVQGTTTAAFYPAGVPTPSVDVVTINSATSASLNIAVPTNTPPGTYGFYMATGGQIVSSSITVYANTPVLSMSPANGLVPTSSTLTSINVSFTGQFTHWSQSGTLPVIAGQGVTLTNFTVTSQLSATGTINIAQSAATGLRLVTFTTGGEIVTTYFNVTSTPVGIIYISPPDAPQSTTLNVTITGLNTHFTQGTTQVIFGGPQITVNSVTVNSLTSLTANITTSYLLSGVLTPTPPGGETVYVNTGAEQVIGGFTVDPPATPTLVSVVPDSAAQGSTVDVVITGSLTNWVNGTTEAILGAGVTVSNLVITSPTTATATIAVSPTAPVGGNSVIMITGSDYVGGTGFSVTQSAAEIVSVEPTVTCQGNFITWCGISGGSGTPYVVAQLQTTTLNLVGVGTHWLQGETTVSFGPGVDVDQLTVSSPTKAQVQITVLSSAPVGYAALTTTTAGEVVTLQQAIDIEEGVPTLLAISPGAGEQGGSYTLQVLGRFTNWGPTTTAAFNQDVTVHSITVIDSETMTANITVSPLAYVDAGSPCGHVLTVTTGSQQVSTAPILDNFCVTQGAEEITAVSPLSGIQGSTETVTITGSATNFLQGVTTVSFGDPNFNVGEVTVNSPTSLTVPVAITTSASTGFKTITATTYGQVASQVYSFTVSPGVGTLNEAIPNQAEQGVQNLTVRLIGQYTHFDALSTATFGAGIVVNSVATVSTTEVDANISIDPLSYAGGRLVTVTTPGLPCAEQPPTGNFFGCAPGATTGTGSEIVTDNAFTIIPGPAIISNVAPNTGNEGQEVVFNITGSATHWQQNFTQFYIAGGGYDLTINSVVINSATSATVDMSISQTANPGVRSIYMVTAGESLTDSGAFVVTGGVPVVTYLSPNGAQPGTTGLPVTINGLYTLWTQAATTVNFGPGITVESYTVDDHTHVSAIIDIASNAQIGYRTVVVQTGTQGLTGNFQVQAPPPPPTPYIWYEYPSSGIPGQTLTINFNGANTQWNPNPTTGTILAGFNASVTVNSFQVTSATTATANVTISPSALASQSTLTFTTPNTTYGTEVDYGTFTVVVAQPTLSIVDPGSGMQGAQDLIVNILGQFTAFDSTTTFNFGPNITVNGPPTILGPTIATQSISIAQLAPTGGYAVTSTTPDAAPAQQVVGGAGFTVTPSLALIASIAPNTAQQGATVTDVIVTGQNTHWDGATVFQFGAGIVVSNTQVTSETSATLTLVIPALAPEGTTSASAHTGGEVASITQGFVVTAGTPLLLSTGPGSVPQQSSAIFTILSQATHWTAANPPVVSYGPGITLTNVTVTGPTSLTVDGYVIPTTNVGYYNLTVSTGTQVLGIPNAVYVSPGPAVVNSVSPSSAGQGVNLPAVQITGINTHWVQGTTQLNFPDVLINSFTVNSPTSITANITVNATAPAGQVNVTATTLGEVAAGINVFTIAQTQPELLSVVASSEVQGFTGTVTVTGDFTDFATGVTTANFGAGITVNSVTASSATSLKVNITVQPTATLGYRNVSVTTGSEVVSLTNGFTVNQGPAAISGLSPANGGQGNSYSVIVTGSQTHFAQGVTTAAFGSGAISVTGVTVNGLLQATVNISIPSSTPLGAYNVTLTTGGEVATILGGFTVGTGTPQISVVNPPTGTQGITENVNLTGLFTHFLQATSVASFGAGITVNSLTVNGSASAVANITISPTATIGSRNVTVTTGSEVATLTGGFSVLAGVPALVSAAPTSAQAGTTANIVIDGTFTTFQQGFTSVSFGSGVTVNFVTVNSTTQVTANITVASNAPVGSQTITVTTNGQALTLPNGFSVTAGTPVITQISPNIGNPGQTLSVTITGLYTNWVNGTTTASFGSGITVNSVTVSSPTSLTANITIGAGAALGPVDVITTTGAEVENVPGGFTVQAAVIPAPTLLSLSPGPNAGGVPINSSFIAVFSQPMNRTTLNTSTVEMWLVSNPGGWVSLPGTVTVDATGRVMTFTPNNLLAVNAQYYMLLTNGIKDATGNTFSQYGYVSFYTVFSANTTAPLVLAANPPANTTNVGTNVTPQLQFSTDMNQSTQSGLTVSAGGNPPIAGTWSWNSYPYGSPSWGPGNLLTFTPTTPLQPNTTYTVSYGAPLADTAGNALASGSFTFTTGAGADTAQNNAGIDFTNYLTNVGTNFAPTVTFSKPIDPIDINTSTLLLYNYDSGKYIAGAVGVAPNGLSATFIPTYPLLPYTYYRIYQAGGNYDMDNNYLNGVNGYFTTGAGADLAPPTVASIFPANSSTSVPLNANVVVHFSEAIDPSTVNTAIQVTPSGGSAIAGVASLASDLVTLTFVPASTLQPGTQYNVQVSGYADMAGNAGSTFTSSFTTAASVPPLIVSTGLDAAGNLITTDNTIDPHWFVNGTSTNAKVVIPGDADFYSGWLANGPSSAWIAPNPASSATAVVGNTLSNTFNWSGSTTNVCLVGGWASDDRGTLTLNGTALLTNVSGWTSLTPFSVPISSSLVAGTNTLTLTWVQTGSTITGYRLQAAIQTCGATYTGGLTLTSSTPANAATNVSTATNISLIFNYTLDPATVNSTTLPVMVGWNSNQEIAGNYQVNGNQVVFTPNSPFPVNTTIYVGACNGPYDTAGDSAGSCYTQLTHFTTGGTVTPPSAPFQVIAFAPAANATNVGLRSPVAATFNRSVLPSSINSSDAALFNGDSQSPWCSSYSRSQDGATLAFNCGALPSSSVMNAYLNGGLQDWSGNGLATFTSQFTTTYSDANTNGSVITSRPGNGASGIDVNEPITIFTNLPIDPSTATNGFEVAQNNVALPGTVQVLDSGYTLLFTPSSPWTPGALIQWWTTASLYESTYDTPVNGASGYFYAAASTGTLTPTVQVASPAKYTNPVPINTIFDVQFNTPLNAATITATNIYVFDNSNGNVHVPVTYSQPQPNEVRMTPTSALPANHYIYVQVTSGLQSTTSVPAAATNWYVYTGAAADSTQPVVTSAVPYNGASNIGVNVTPGVIFNKSIDPVSVNSATFQVLNGATPLAGGFWFNSNNTRVEFVPNAPLPANTSLTMILNGVLDQVGNSVTFSSTFQTGPGPDFATPTVVWSSVASSESIPTNSAITIQFSESMDVSTFSTGSDGDLYIYDTLLGIRVPATLSWNSAQTVAYLLPSSPLAAGRTYYLYVNSGTDFAGNTVSSYQVTFYAGFSSSSTAPTVINFNPLSGATGLGTNAIVEAQFSAPVDPNFLAGVTLSQGGSTVSTTPVMSAANTILQLVLRTPLAPNTTYAMTISGVKDPAGNTVATATNTFTTGATYDIASPSAISSNPPNNSTVGTNLTPELIFNKPLNPITVNSSSFRIYLADTGQWIPLVITPSTDGKTVSTQPQVALLPYTKYHFQACCGFQDQDGNNGTQADVYFWTNGGTDTTGPTVSVSPANGATGIPLNAKVIVSVNSIMDPTSWTQSSIQLLNGSTPVSGTVGMPNVQELIFAPAGALSASTTYKVKVNGFTDANGNAVVPSTTTFTTGAAASGGGLTFTSSNITNGATNVPATQPIILSFSQILVPSTVNSSTLMVMDTWNSNRPLAGTYSVNGNLLTITPVSPWPAGANVTVGECGGPTDILGDVFLNGACYGQQLVSFTVTTGSPDTTALQVLSVSPSNGATNVRHDLPVSVTFNKAINPGTTSGYNTLLYAGQDLQTNGSVTLSADGRTLTFNVGALSDGTTYTIAIPAGGVADESGNALAGNFISTFTTAVNPATGSGSVQGTSPGNNASGVPTNTLLTLYMNRPVDPSTLPGNLTVTVNGNVDAGTVQSVASGYEIQFSPTTPFPNGATVQWFLSGNVLDVYGDYFNGTSGYFYTAPAVNAAIASPQIVAVSPPCCSSPSMPTNGEIDIQYSLPIDPATLSGNVYRNSGPATPAFTVGLAPGTTNVVRISPSSPWNASTFYGFCTNANVKGVNGVAAQSSCWTTYFTTGAGPDSTSGTVTIGPPDGAVNVGTNAYIRLQFSKPIDVTTINSANVQITAGGIPIPGTWSFNLSSGDYVGANFTPVNPLPPSSTIQVSVNGLLDYAGNTFTPSTAQFTAAALPDYSTPTAALDFSSWQAGISTTASFSCRYSEPMDPSSVTASNTYIHSYVSNASVPVAYAWSADLMSVTMTPLAPLFANSQYVYYCSGAIDLTGNGQSYAAAGFYTGNGPSSAGPVLLQANPPNGFTNVPLNTNNGPWYGSSLGLLFNEPVAADTLENITLTPAGGSPIPIAVYPEYGNTIAWVQLPWALAPNTQYSYNISGVTDLSGNAITPVTSTFTTGSSYDFTSPAVTAVVPANSTTGVAVNTAMSVTFSEAMNPVLITSSQIYLRLHNQTSVVIPATLSLSADFKTVTLTPTAPLAQSTIYDIVYWPNNWYLYDIAGNPNTQYGVESTFTTGTASAVNGACGSANGGSFSSPPSAANLCSAGTTSAITNPGSWTWTCNGQYGGTSASCSATVAAGPACYSQQSSLVSWWKGNDDATDHMGNNNGTLENGAGFALGEVGDAFSLNGNNQYVLIGQPVPTDLQIQNAITLSAWIYVTGYPADNGNGALGLIVGSQHDGNYAGASIFYDGRTNPDSMTGIPPGHIAFNIGDGSNWHITNAATQVPLNQWTLVTATRAANGLGQIYYNGALQPAGTTMAWNGTASYSGSWFAIGQEVNQNRPFNGLIDEVQVYNTALTATQVQNIYSAGSSGVCP